MRLLKITTLLLAIFFISSSHAATTDWDDPELISQGEYLTKVGDCAACHTARAGKPFAGGMSLPTPFGSVAAPNITPHQTTGIGNWDFEDFWQALHFGKSPAGERLYPVFPYTSYTRVTREDAKAIFAYLQSITPVNQPDEQPDLRFPYNLRTGLIFWRAMYFDPGEYEPDPKQSRQWNRGAYLVEGLGHCNECHTPRNSLGGLDPDQSLEGAVIPAQDWYAPDLSMQEGGGLEGWTQQDVIDLLKTGQSNRGYVFGPMADVVRLSTQHMTDEDLKAIAVYLESLEPRGAIDKASIEPAPNLRKGKKVYAHYCADCHADDGSGKQGKYPPLDGNSAVNGPSGVNAIRNTLLGGFAPATKHNPFPYSMPPYAPILDDGEVAAVVNYIRQSWSNMAPTVYAEDVKAVREAPTN